MAPSQLPIGERPAIRAEGYAIDLPRVPFDSVLLCACDGIPQTNGIVPAHTGERPAIRTECYAIDRIRMPGEQSDFGTGACIVEPNTDGTGDSESRSIR